ncbi:MAG: toprim domain-containing protein, partial [Clostridia bacterium]|nr:toprim domain-containing protein [Clostridia bacterium]
PNFAKYLNTSETPIFSKSKNLYAINLIRKQRQNGPIDYMIIVEGYVDVISLHKAGFTTAVASMGTALTLEQAKLIKRYTSKVFICYDGDSAGKNATIRGLEILKENDLDVFIVSLPDPLDPDDVINKYGAEGYQKLLDEAKPLLEFKIEHLSQSFDLSNLDGKTKYAASAIEELSKASEVEREMYLPVVARVSGLNIDFLRRMMKGEEGQAVVSDKRESKPEKILPNTTIMREVAPADGSLVKAEKLVLSSILQKKPYAFPKSNYSHLFTGERVRMFEFLFGLRDEEKSVIIPKFYEEFSGADSETGSDMASEIISFSMSEGDEDHENAYYKDCLWLLVKRHLQSEVDEKTKKLSSIVETDKRRALMAEINELIMKIKSKKVDL